MGLSLGTGIMKIVNIGLMLLVAGGIIFAAWNAIKGKWINEGRDQVTEQVEDDNQNLTNHVTTLNDEINRRVVITDQVINRNSREIEDAIDEQPSEAISNVTRTRLDRVREQQQRDIPEASR
jgi:cell division protein FtsB